MDEENKKTPSFMYDHLSDLSRAASSAGQESRRAVAEGTGHIPTAGF
jgi:hypothetical protein